MSAPASPCPAVTVRGRSISLAVHGVASVDVESIAGNVHLTGDLVPERLAAIVAVAEEMAKRYLGPNGPAYIKPTIQQPRWLIKVTPDNVKTWEGLGWAKKYWVESDTSVSHQDAHAS